jgi:arginine exporter protein ArgO
MTKGITNKARSILYILIISGLLSSTAIIIMLVWNETLIHKLETSSISFLESVGIVSFVYIIYYGIRFGQESCQNSTETAKTTADAQSSDNLTDSQVHTYSELLKQVPDDDKKRLKMFLSKCCGMSHEHIDRHSSFGSKSSAKKFSQ